MPQGSPSIRQISRAEALRLKQAVSGLIDKAGGVRAAAIDLQLSATRISEAASQFHDDRWLSLLHVAELECLAGEPAVARVLADAAGFDLAPRSAARPASLHHLFARVVVDCSEVQSATAEALADGTVTDAERGQIIAEIGKAVTALHSLAAQIKVPLKEVK